MTWENFYLVCFLVGFGLTAISFLLGSLDFHVHLPHAGHGPDFHFGGHADVGHAHAGQAHAAHAGDGGHGASGSEPQISWFNFGTVTAFLAWFGGAGYLLSAYSPLGFAFTLLIAVALGMVGGSIMFWFIAKFLMKHDKALSAHDYEMVGVLGTVSSSIREGGTGEIVFTQEGTRRCAGARSENGQAIPRNAEVVVTRYERGIAYVRTWDEFAAEHKLSSGAAELKGEDD